MKETTSKSEAVRTVLQKNIDMPAAEVVKKVLAMGVKGDEKKLTALVHNIRSTMKKKLGGGTKEEAVSDPTPSPVHVTNGKSEANGHVPTPPSVEPAPANHGLPTDLKTYIATTGLVAELAKSLGGAEKTRYVVEVIKRTGGYEPFLQHLELVENLTAK